MIDFGFSLSPTSRINLDKADRTLLARLAQLEPDFKKCMACGSCCASCSAGKFTSTSLRSAINLLKNGLAEEAVKILNGCMLCGKCTMVCPRGINTRNLIISINKIYGK